MTSPCSCSQENPFQLITCSSPIPSSKLDYLIRVCLPDAQEFESIFILGTSLVIQWLRIRLPMQGMQVQSLVGELRSHMLQGN